MRRNKPSTILEQVAEQTGQAFEQAKEQAGAFSEKIAPMVSDARERLTPMVEDARDRLTPMMEDARDRLTPMMEDARERFAELAEAGAARIAEAAPDTPRDAVPTAVAERLPDSVIDTSGPSRKGKVARFLVFFGLGAAAAAVAKVIRDRNAEPEWHSGPTAVPSMPKQAAGPISKEDTDDTAGSSPDEALADEAESAHPVTTPDAPAETVVIEDQPRI